LAKYPRLEAIYTTLLMSTGLTFGTISALFGLSHGVITEEAILLFGPPLSSEVPSFPTVIANAFICQDICCMISQTATISSNEGLKEKK